MAPAPLIGIIDDSEVYRDALERLLRSAGYSTILFESADAFIISTRNDEPDCLILDYQMPGTTGLELARRLTGMSYSAPFIMVSVDAEDLREAALKAGAVAVCSKRASPDGLLDAIHVALETWTRGRRTSNRYHRLWCRALKAARTT
jgi:FixJ family two-component response regulator